MPEFAFEHHAVAPLLLSAGACCTACLLQSACSYGLTSPAHRALSSKPITAAVNRWDRWKDGRTKGRSTVT